MNDYDYTLTLVRNATKEEEQMDLHYLPVAEQVMARIDYAHDVQAEDHVAAVY